MAHASFDDANPANTVSPDIGNGQKVDESVAATLPPPEPAGLPPGWSSYLIGRLRQTQFVTRVTFLVVVLGISFYCIGMHERHLVRENIHWKFWLQVFTSNWSPDQPAKPNDPAINEHSSGSERYKLQDYISDKDYIFGTVFALVVNLGSFVLIFGALIAVWKAERKKIMDVEICRFCRRTMRKWRQTEACPPMMDCLP